MKERQIQFSFRPSPAHLLCIVLFNTSENHPNRIKQTNKRNEAIERDEKERDIEVAKKLKGGKK